MRLDLFDYDLPEDRIAQFPVSPRDSARLLRVRGGAFSDHRVSDLVDLLRSGDLLIFNNSRVLPSFLRGRLASGVGIRVNLHKRVAADSWLSFVRSGKRAVVGVRIFFADDFWADVVEEFSYGERLLRFNVGGDDLLECLRAHGEMPLPPYIKRSVRCADDERNYQTVYASCDGAVAAPTAGLHFSDVLLEGLRGAGIELSFVTLHVGAGTFLPVRVSDTDDHEMHSEYGEVLGDVWRSIGLVRERGGRIIAVGTTSLRILESAYLACGGEAIDFCGETDIFITPGFEFGVVDMLLTNFHLPRSTLLMLVSAFSGLSEIRDAYDYALRGGYRFFSYGDACLLERNLDCSFGL